MTKTALTIVSQHKLILSLKLWWEIRKKISTRPLIKTEVEVSQVFETWLYISLLHLINLLQWLDCCDSINSWCHNSVWTPKIDDIWTNWENALHCNLKISKILNQNHRKTKNYRLLIKGRQCHHVLNCSRSQCFLFSGKMSKKHIWKNLTFYSSSF